MTEKLAAKMTGLIKACLIIFAGLMAGGALITTKQVILGATWTSPKRSLFVFVLVTILIIAGCWLLAVLPDQKTTNYLVLGVLLVAFALLMIAWIYSTPAKQTSDYHTFWKYGQQAVAGGPIYYHDNNYFAKWAYQTGFLTYVMAVIKLFGANIRSIQLLNVLWQILSLLLTYVLAQKLFHQVAISRISLFLLGINWEWLALNNRVTNQYIATVFFLLTWLLLLDKKTSSWILAGVTLAIGNMLRPLSLVFIAAIIVFALIYRFFNTTNNWRQGCLRLGGLLLVYLVITLSCGALIKQSGLNEYGLSNRDTEWKFVIGLNYPSTGSYSQPLVKEFNLKDTRKTMLKQEKQVTQRHIKYLNQHHLWLKLFIKKFFIVWSNPSNTLNFSLFAKNHSLKTVNQVNLWAYAITVVEILLTLLGAIVLAFKKYHSGFNLLLLTLFAYAAAQVIIEVQGRYRIEFVPLLVIIAAVGFTQLVAKKKPKTNNFEVVGDTL